MVGESASVSFLVFFFFFRIIWLPMIPTKIVAKGNPANDYDTKLSNYDNSQLCEELARVFLKSNGIIDGIHLQFSEVDSRTKMSSEQCKFLYSIETDSFRCYCW